MTFLPFLAALAIIALAAYRVLSKFHLPPALVGALSLLVSAALVVPPAILFSTDPPDTGPAGGSGPAELVVEPTTGWLAGEAGNATLTLASPGRATVVIGPAGSGRPDTDVAVRARAVGTASMLTVERDGHALASARLPVGTSRLRFALPGGPGPAQLVFAASPRGGTTGTIVVESLRAFIEGGASSTGQ